jgi:hypothetical protein
MKIYKKIIQLGVAMATGSFISAQANTLADWTFETTTPATAGPYSPETGNGSASGSHAGAATYSSPSGNGSTHSFSANTWAVGDYYQFQVSTMGYDDVTLSYDQTSSNTGPGAFELGYSTDGVNFTYLPSYTVVANAAPNTTWNPTTYNPAYTFTDDLSSVLAIDNEATVYLRLADFNTVSANGGTVATAGTDRVDNFNISAQPVPEPASIALAVLGGLALVVRRNRRV